jgi:nucleoprotein TPR
MSSSQDLRAQVIQERDNARHLSLQKELELKELQARLEKKVESFSFSLFLFHGSFWV